MQHPLAEKEVPAEVVRQGKRVTIAAVSRTELSFVVNAPDIIRFFTLTKRLGVRRGVPFPFSSFNETFFLKDTPGGTWRWPGNLRVSLLKVTYDFLRSPVGMMEPEIDEPTNDFRGGRFRVYMRSTRPVFKTGRAVLFVTCDPLVNGLTANPVNLAKLGDGKIVFK
jgi:hypothetical protein